MAFKHIYVGQSVGQSKQKKRRKKDEYNPFRCGWAYNFSRSSFSPSPSATLFLIIHTLLDYRCIHLHLLILHLSTLHTFSILSFTFNSNLLILTDIGRTSLHRFFLPHPHHLTSCPSFFTQPCCNVGSKHFCDLFDVEGWSWGVAWFRGNYLRESFL